MNPALFDWDSLTTLLKLERVKNDDGSEWLNASCPLHRDNRPSFGINKSTGVYNCYVCGSGSIVDLLRAILGISLDEAKEKLETFSSSPLAFEAWLRSFDDNISVERKKHNGYNTFLSEGMLRMYRTNPKNYHSLMLRGFDAKILAEAEVGYDRVLQRLTFPIRNKQGLFTGIVGRTVKRKNTGQARWKVYWETRIREQLYNINNVLDRQHLLITEGPLDVLRAVQFDYPREAVVGIFSATPTKTQIEMIRQLNPKSLTIALDNDEAGSIGTAKLYEAFIDELPIFQVEFPKDTKDLGEQTYENFWKMIKNKHSPIIRKIAGISAYKIGFS